MADPKPGLTEAPVVLKRGDVETKETHRLDLEKQKVEVANRAK